MQSPELKPVMSEAYTRAKEIGAKLLFLISDKILYVPSKNTESVSFRQHQLDIIIDQDSANRLTDEQKDLLDEIAP